MSSFPGFGLFKRAKAKSRKEVQPLSIVTASMPSSSVDSAVLSSANRTPASGAESYMMRAIPYSPDCHGDSSAAGFPASGNFYPSANFSSPSSNSQTAFHGHVSPLQSSASPMSPNLQSGPLPSSSAQIPIRSPTLSYGHIREREFSQDPTFAPRNLETVTEQSSQGHRRSASSKDVRSDNFANCSYESAPSESPSLPFGVSIAREEFARRLLTNVHGRTAHTPMPDERTWTPRENSDTDSLYSGDLQEQTFPNISGSEQHSNEPPKTPLPRLPSDTNQHQEHLVRHEISTTTDQYSRSSESYGNTRNLLGLPASRLATGQTPEQSYARLSIIDQDGSVVSQPLSEAETRDLERDIDRNLRRSGTGNMASERDSYRDTHDHIGRMSIEYSADPGPGSSQRSSLNGFNLSPPQEADDQQELGFGREGRLGFYQDRPPPRSGTPPLLFGRRGLDMSESAPQGIRSNGRLAQVLAASRLRSNSRLTKATEGDDEGDWETEAGSGSFSRHAVRAAIAHAGTGSSLADNSDSGSLSASKVTKTSSMERVVQPPAHARYSQNWNLLQDKQTGNMVLMPGYERPTGAEFHNVNALKPVATRRSPYQHPSPLSIEHRHTLSSSPQRSSAQVAPLFAKASKLEPRSKRSKRPMRENIDLQLVSHESPLSRAMMSGFGSGVLPDRETMMGYSRERKEVSYPSSGWLSTSMSGSLSNSNEFLDRAGSHAKLTTLSAKPVLTATPQSTRTRQVGSSLAGASDLVATSPFDQHSPRQYTPPRELSLPSTYPSPIGASSSSPQFSPLATPSSRDRLGRKHTHNHTPTPSSTSHSAKILHRRTFDGSMNSAEVRAANDTMNERLRRYPGTRNLTMYDEEQEALLLASSHANLSPEIRRHRQDLVNHSLLKPLPEPPFTEPKRLSVPLELISKGSSSKTTNNLSTSVELKVGATAPQLSQASSGHHIRQRSIHRYSSTGDLALDVKTDEGDFIQPAPLSPTRLDRTRALPLSSKPEPVFEVNLAIELGNVNPNPSQDHHGADTPAPWNGGPYGDFILRMRDLPTPQLTRPIPRRCRSGQRQRQFAREEPPHLYEGYRRSVARVDSPRLHQLPRLTRNEAVELQREVSRKYLFWFANPLLFVLLPLLGYGSLDGLMVWHTNGAIANFGAQEKVLAWWIAGGLCGCWAIGAVVGLIFMLR